MLHLPLETPRGLVHRHYTIRGTGEEIIIYAYHFPGTSELDMAETVRHRPREKLPGDLFRLLEPSLQFLHAHVKDESKAAMKQKERDAMRLRPTFPTNMTMELHDGNSNALAGRR